MVVRKLKMQKIFSRLTLFFVITLFSGSHPLHCEPEFKLVEKWPSNVEILLDIHTAIVDSNDNLVSFFSGGGLHFVINKNSITKFGPHGQGPSDIFGAFALYNYKKGEIAVIEWFDKIKVFAFTNGTYVWKETKWLKKVLNQHIPRAALFYENKLFIAGKGYVLIKEDYEGKRRKRHGIFFLRVYDDNGKSLKNFFNSETDKADRFDDMAYHLTSFKNKIYYFREDRLAVKIVCPKKLEFEKEVPLEAPGFYKKMPENFYEAKRRSDIKARKDSEHWKTGYSRINHALVEGDYLVLHIRTCNEKLKRYALLFYNASTFELEKTVYTDDWLLAAKNGRYYCYAGGNPRFDEAEDIETLKINVYSFEKK